MPLVLVALPSMTVSSGGTATNAIRQFDDAWALSIYSPNSTLTSTAVTISVEPTSTGTAFMTLQSAGADITLTSGKAMVISPVPFQQMRLDFGTAEAAERIFSVRKTVLT